MNVQEELKGDVLVVRIGQKVFDAHMAGPFREHMAALIDAGRRQVVVDMTGVELLDSTGLGALVSARKRIVPSGGLALFGVGRTVAGVLRLTRMDQVFAIAATEDEAIARVSSRQPAPSGASS